MAPRPSQPDGNARVSTGKAGSRTVTASEESGYFVSMKRRDFLRSSASLGAVVTTVGLSPATLGASENPPCVAAPFPQTPGLTKYVVEFVRNTKFTDLPADVIEFGKKSILDGLGLALAGARAQNGKLFREYAASLGLPDRGATVMGTKNKLTPRFAAFANGLAIHVEDFDDTQLAAGKDRVYGLLTHPTVPVLPAALAFTDTAATSAKDFLVAYHLGVEVECKIAEAISPRHYEDGFHSTGTCGVFGGTTACAKLRAFDESQISRAFGIAASQGAGLRENFGTMMKSFHAGHAAEIGIFATDLAALGWTGAEQILEADRGFFHAFGGSYDPSAILLIEGKAGLGEFTDAVVNRPDVQAMIDRIHFGVDPQAEKAGYDKMTTILKIHLKDGRVIAGRADFGKGSPANPMSYDEVAEKFHGCADFAQWPAARASKIVELVRHLENLEDMRTLTELCSG